MMIARMAFALVMSAGPALMGCVSVAQADDDLRIPETTRILRFESHQSCPGCPAYIYELYADGSWHYEGVDAVFMLGTSGSYLPWQARRKAFAERGSSIHASVHTKDAARREISNYSSYVRGATRPNSTLSKTLHAVESSGFFTLEERYPPDLDARGGGGESMLSLQIEAGGRSKTVRFLPGAAPTRLSTLVAQIMAIGEPFSESLNYEGRHVSHYWIHPSPPFWSDPDAVLWYARPRLAYPKSYGVILYRTDKATIFGWNNVGADSTEMLVRSVQLPPGHVERLLNALDSAGWSPLPERLYQNPALHPIVQMVFGGHHDDNRLLRKDRVGTLGGPSRLALEDLKNVVNSMVPLLGRDDPVHAKPRGPAGKETVRR